MKGKDNLMSLTSNEKVILKKLYKDSDVKYQRKSEKEFDIEIEGDGFSAWLPLAAIRSLTKWTRPSVALLSDYPEMVIEGDWSGIRDSSDEAIWDIFETYVQNRKDNSYGFC